MKIYTKHGDDGSTGLFGGTRVAKSSLRIQTYGTVDELNSVIGVVRASQPDVRTDEMCAVIQPLLFRLGAELATHGDHAHKAGNVHIGSAEITTLEHWIDELEVHLPALKSFILPGGALSAAQLHVARTVCRRAERYAVRLSEIESLRKEILMVLNRLSDLLFVLARYENFRKGIADVEWKS